MGLRRSLVATALGCAAATAAAADCLFVNTNSATNSVAAFVVNADGSLTAAAGSPFASGGTGGFNAAVGSAGLCAAGSRLYATNPISNDVSGFDIAADCILSPVPGSPFVAGDFAVSVEPDPAGAFLYVSNFGDDTISVFAIAVDGSLSEIAASPFTTPDSPFDIQFDPAGGRFFVSHDFANAVGVYDQAIDGSFTPVAGSPFAAAGTEHGLVANPSASRVYVTDVGPSSITGFSVGAGGALTPLGGSPYAAGANPLDLLVDPSDSNLYVSENGTSTVGAYAIDAAGDLTPLAASPFASDSLGPAGLTQDPAGSFLYVANGGFAGSPDVSVYAVAMDGSIAPIAGSPFATGGTGQASGIAYLVTAPAPMIVIPTLSRGGMTVLVLLVLLAALALLRVRVL